MICILNIVYSAILVVGKLKDKKSRAMSKVLRCLGDEYCQRHRSANLRATLKDKKNVQSFNPERKRFNCWGMPNMWFNIKRTNESVSRAQYLLMKHGIKTRSTANADTVDEDLVEIRDGMMDEELESNGNDLPPNDDDEDEPPPLIDSDEEDEAEEVTLRRSRRVSKMPQRFNDYIIAKCVQSHMEKNIWKPMALQRGQSLRKSWRRKTRVWT